MFIYSYATLCNYQNVFMHKSEPRANPTLIAHASKVYELIVGPLEPIGVLAPS